MKKQKDQSKEIKKINLDNLTIIEKLDRIPNASKFEKNKVKNRFNWFNQNLIIFISIIGVCLGIIIVGLIILL